jgi:hypothetical protein
MLYPEMELVYTFQNTEPYRPYDNNVVVYFVMDNSTKMHALARDVKYDHLFRIKSSNFSVDSALSLAATVL